MGYHHGPWVGYDCNNNGIDDLIDISSGTSSDCDGNQIPDSCDIAFGLSLDCNLNGTPDECDISSGLVQDCNGNGIPDYCEILIDCNGNSVPDECDIWNGTSLDCNWNGVPDECEVDEADCNENGIPDDCDIAAGTSQDCNLNGTPDECEVDCNENGIPDDCDIAAGTSEDLNGNGIPDECECFDPVTYCSTSPNSVGAGALIGSSGLPSITYNSFHLTVVDAPPTQFGLFYYGLGTANSPFGNGLRCVGGGQVFRILPPAMTDGSGSASRHLDFTAPPADSGDGKISAGDTWHFQYWYRDPAGGGWQFNLSDGLKVIFCP